MGSVMDLHLEQRVVIGFLTEEKCSLIQIHTRLNAVCGETCVDVSTVIPVCGETCVDVSIVRPVCDETCVDLSMVRPVCDETCVDVTQLQKTLVMNCYHT